MVRLSLGDGDGVVRIRNEFALIANDVNAYSRSVGRQLLYSYKLNPQMVFFLGIPIVILTTTIRAL